MVERVRFLLMAAYLVAVFLVMMGLGLVIESFFLGSSS